jgi:AraC-like DNA-binding protein
LLVIDLADVHSAEVADFNHLTLVIPRPLLAPHLLNPDSQEGRVLKADNGLTTLAVNHMNTLAQVIGNIKKEDVMDVVEPTLLLLASSLNGTVDSVEGGSAGVVNSYLSRAKLLIEQNLQREFTIDWLCSQLNISRAGLYRLFASLGGVKSYIQERRLKKCTQQLLSPHFAHLPIYDIANRWGFHNESYFSRAFKQRYGVSPRAARNASNIQGSKVAVSAEHNFGDRYYEQWLTDVLKS